MCSNTEKIISRVVQGKVVLVGNSQQDLTGYTCFQLIVHSTGYNRFHLADETYLFHIILHNVFLKYNLLSRR